MNALNDLIEVVAFSVMLGFVYTKADIRGVIALAAYYLGMVIRNTGLTIKRSLNDI